MPMNDLDALDVQPDDEEETLDGPPADDALDPQQEAARYLATVPGSPERAAIAAEWTNDQRAIMQGLGITGPLAATEEGFKANPYFNEQQARAELTAALSQIRAGGLDVAPETFARLEDLAEEAERLPDATEELQRAVWLLNRVKAAQFESAPFRPVRTTTRTVAGGAIEVEEQDEFERRRVTRYGAEEVEARRAQRATVEGPPDPEKVTLETVKGWSIERMLAFADANPDAWERLKHAEGEARDEAHRAAGW